MILHVGAASGKFLFPRFTTANEALVDHKLENCSPTSGRLQGDISDDTGGTIMDYFWVTSYDIFTSIRQGTFPLLGFIF